ncbi:MAG: hypothetical protein ACQGVK_12555 [Myxococcota bacterium]
MSESTPPPAQAPGLHLLGGQPAPPEISIGWRQLQQLPLKALANLWEMLMPVVAGAQGEAVAQQAEAFCKVYGVEEAQLQTALRVGHFLVTRSAAANLDGSRFQADLKALSGEDQSGVEVLTRGYEEARQHARNQILEATLFDHGQVLTGLDWRLDNIMASDRGMELGMPVVVLTFRHRQRDETKQTSLYVLPQLVSQLKQTCEQLEALLGAGGAGPAGGAPR